MVGRLLVAGLLASVASIAQAGETVRYEAVPAWVKRAPPVDATKVDGDSPLLLVADSQSRLADGEVWTYSEVATRMASPDIVQKAGTVSLAWQPSKGDLIVHQLEIIRGAQHIDVLAGGKKFTVIRREQQLEQMAINGQLTATMAVEGVRVGDVLHLVASITNREPALKGDMQAQAALPALPFKVGFSRARFLWPASLPVKWRTYTPDAQATETVAGGLKELIVTGPLPKAVELPGDAPIRYRPMPLIEATTFADWAAVSKVMAPLYATGGTIAPGSDLAKEVAAIAASSPDPLKRTAAALELVQEKVRYLFNGMENGNYMPQAPAQTWALRYGDCKAKTLLLLAILDALKVEAEPVLASSQLGDYVPKRLPSAGAFDHVLVRATIAGQSYWLDGTATGSRMADLRDTPAFRWVLPVRAAGATTMELPLRAPSAPQFVADIAMDQSAGLGMPTIVHGVFTVRGQTAEMIGLVKTQGSKEQKEEMLRGLLGTFVGQDMLLSGYDLTYDQASASASVNVDAVITTPWRFENKRYRFVLDRSVQRLSFEPDRSRVAWQAIPVATGVPETSRVVMHVKLPAGLSGFSFDGDQTVPDALASTRIARRASLDGGMVTLDDTLSADGAEIAPADVASMKSRVARAKSRLLRVVAPADVPNQWGNAQLAQRDGRYKPLLAAYTKAIALNGDEVTTYQNRANYFIGLRDYRSALGDLDRAVALDGSVENLQQRARVYRILGDLDKARTGFEAALKVDPTSGYAISELGEIDILQGRKAAAIARIDEQIANAGDDKPNLLATRAALLEYAGDKDAALSAADEAVAAKPGNPQNLNSRCWIKGQLNTALDTALKDCTKAIELSDNTAAALDSRAMIYLRMNRLDDALADADAALDQYPNLASSLWLRGIIRKRRGDVDGARDDLAAARFIDPMIEKEYARFGMVP